jgi:hypothetical protein
MGEFNIVDYLFNVAPVAVVLGLSTWELWKHNKDLTEKIHARDLENLRTLEQMLGALRQIEEKGTANHDDLKNHITERVASIRARLEQEE